VGDFWAQGEEFDRRKPGLTVIDKPGTDFEHQRGSGRVNVIHGGQKAELLFEISGPIPCPGIIPGKMILDLF
jgi:hypothetical protein